MCVRKHNLKLDLRQKSLIIIEKDLELEKTKGLLAGVQDLAAKLGQDNNDLRQVVGGLEERLKGCESEVEKVSKSLEAAEKERDGLEERFERIESVDAGLWCRECSTDCVPPAFVSKERRKTVFVAVQNLKGGVGKTTLVANLAAAYATSVTGQAKTVLAVDLDFQGSLSNCCTEEDDLSYRRTNRLTSACLLHSDHQPPEDLLRRLAACISGTQRRGKLIVADESLENVDFQKQSRFAVMNQEVRFEHRRMLHDESVFREFDLVLFDCPPRLTTSSINALFASDFVIIPTTLAPPDVQSVPRTLQWLTKLGRLASYPPRLAGIIVNRVYYRDGTLDRLTAEEQRQLERLRLSVQKYVPTGGAILTNAIHASPEVPRYAAGSLPLGTTQKGRDLYEGVAVELYERING